MSTRRGPLDRVFRSVVTRAVEAIDPDEILEQVDLDQILATLDLDALLDRIDWNAVLERVDPNVVLDRVDPDRLLARVDPNVLLDRVDAQALLDRVDPTALLDKVDPNALVARLDVDDLVSRVDLDALAARIDLNAVLSRVDMNRLLSTVDPEPLLERVDVAGLVARAGVDRIIADATTGIAGRALDVLQRAVAEADRLPLGLTDRVFRRDPVHWEHRDHRAGPLARVLAFAADWALMSGLFSGGVVVLRLLVGMFTSGEVVLERSWGVWWIAAYALWWWTYFWMPVALTGRTFGKALLGLKVVRMDGSRIGPRRAAIRALVLPLSLVGGLGVLPALIHGQGRALHDFAAGTREISD